jgi:hypothetical protein
MLFSRTIVSHVSWVQMMFGAATQQDICITGNDLLCSCPIDTRSIVIRRVAVVGTVTVVRIRQHVAL